jgi:uncharacterized protein YqhQ
MERPSEKSPWKGWPLIRGVVTLGQAMMLGFKALRYSANVALEEVQADTAKDSAAKEANKDAPKEKKFEISGWVAALNITLSLGFFIFMYKFVPYLATKQLRRLDPQLGNQVLFAVVEGLIRLALFLGFIWLTAQWSEIRRVYQYHGAEHKTVFAFEAGDRLEAATVQRWSTFHPRCGTSFLMTVMLIAIAMYAMIPIRGFWAGFGMRLLLLPLIAGVSYEVIRFAAKRRSSLFAIMTRPGLWLQRITTRQPDDSQVECAIVALNQAMELEKQRGGELVIA